MRIDGAAYIVDLTRPEALPGESGLPEPPLQAEKPARRARRFDRIEISSEVKELSRLKRELEALPEVRLDRVALARQNLQAGGYRVASIDLAQKMMDSFGTR